MGLVRRPKSITTPRAAARRRFGTTRRPALRGLPAWNSRQTRARRDRTCGRRPPRHGMGICTWSLPRCAWTPAFIVAAWSGELGGPWAARVCWPDLRTSPRAAPSPTREPCRHRRPRTVDVRNRTVAEAQLVAAVAARLGAGRSTAASSDGPAAPGHKRCSARRAGARCLGPDTPRRR